MGSGSWSTRDFADYTCNTKMMKMDDRGRLDSSYGVQDIFTEKRLHPLLNPNGVIRECCENSEHPNTMPVILALDVTGSMGRTATEIAKGLSVLMTKLYQEIPDIEIMVMGIGDFVYDAAPLQVSQFESDIRIAEQLDKIYFEGHGGGNMSESYSSAWYFGAFHTKLDCWKRGKKGIIITMGDELLNPYLPGDKITRFIGDNNQGDIETSTIYNDVKDKYELFHIQVKHDYTAVERTPAIADSFKKVIGDQNYCECENVDTINDMIFDIIKSYSDIRDTFVQPHTTSDIVSSNSNPGFDQNGDVVW